MTLKFDELIRVSDNRYPGVTYTLQDGDSNLFQVIESGENVDITLKTDFVPEDMNGRTSFAFNVIASLEDVVDGQSAVIIDIIPPVVIPSPVFEKPLYEGSIADDFTITLEDIKISEGYDDAIEFLLIGCMIIINHGFVSEYSFM